MSNLAVLRENQSLVNQNLELDINTDYDKCDKFDYLLSIASGVISGLVDVFFVGSPLDSKLLKSTDKVVDGMVKTFAKTNGWNPKAGNEENVASAIGFLERKFKVNYDHRHTADVGGAFNMSASDHHFRSLAHSPDPIGLFFSILDQFTGQAHFIANGQIVKINSDFTLSGSNFVSKLFCGFVNWLGHIMSDIAGSSGAKTRGSGVCIPFMELFQFCDFGSFNQNGERITLANAMVEVFREGYDFRFGMAMAIPVLLNELIVRAFWVIKRKFYKKRPWKDCIPTTKNHSDLRMMLIISNASLCVIDGIDALVRSGGNIVAFITRFNIVAWSRLVLLILKELKICYGPVIYDMIKSFLNQLDEILTESEKQNIKQYYDRMSELDIHLDKMLNEFITQINKEYEMLSGEIELINSEDISEKEKADHSVNIAVICKVDDKEIINDLDDLDDFFLN